MFRAVVYNLIDGERDYQDRLWNRSKTQQDNRHTNVHSLEEWNTYMMDYIQEAQHILSREAAPECDRKAANIMRKVVAMGICALEQHGCEPRGEPEPAVVQSHGIKELA